MTPTATLTARPGRRLTRILRPRVWPTTVLPRSTRYRRPLARPRGAFQPTLTAAALACLTVRLRGLGQAASAAGVARTAPAQRAAAKVARRIIGLPAGLLGPRDADLERPG